MSVTLSDVRTLLDRALTHIANPAILRLPESERTVEGLAQAYLPFTIYNLPRHAGDPVSFWPSEKRAWLPKALNLTDPGTCHAALVALALALGLDPGVGGLGALWQPVTDGTREECVVGWFVGVKYDARYFVMLEHLTGDGDEFVAPKVAAEFDPIKALALAVHHVIAEKDAP